MPAPPPAPRPKRSGFLAAIERFEGVYNRGRRHSGLGFLTAAQAYEQMARAA